MIEERVEIDWCAAGWVNGFMIGAHWCIGFNDGRELVLPPSVDWVLLCAFDEPVPIVDGFPIEEDG